MKIEPGQRYKYTGKIKSFPKEVEVIEENEKLKLMATIASGKYKEKLVDGGESEHVSPEDEVHALFVLTSHMGDWKLIK